MVSLTGNTNVYSKPMGRHNGFAARKKRYLIFTDGENIRHFAISPITIICAFGLLGCVTFGFFISTSYILFNDNLASSLLSRNARLQHVYEDRITDLRAEIDRLTQVRITRQRRTADGAHMIRRGDDRQEARSGFATSGTRTDTGSPKPQPLDDKQANNTHPPAAGILGSIDATTASTSIARRSIVNRAAISTDLAGAQDNRRLSIARATSAMPSSKPENARPRSQVMSESQREKLARLETTTRRKIVSLRKIAKKVGLSVPQPEGMGGPLRPITEAPGRLGADKRISRVKTMVAYMRKLRAEMERMPLRRPIAGNAPITSRFGPRVDPFIRRAAMHSGIDFRARRGRKVLAAGTGKVVFAGRKGGYGKLVEINHGDGVRTRYAHLSKIHVRVGKPVKAGQVIGRVGSTGRSTGPHLHYETLINDKAVNPLKYIKAGTQLARL